MYDATYYFAIAIIGAWFFVGLLLLGRVFEETDRREAEEETRERLHEVWSRGRR